MEGPHKKPHCPRPERRTRQICSSRHCLARWGRNGETPVSQGRQTLCLDVVEGEERLCLACVRCAKHRYRVVDASHIRNNLRTALSAAVSIKYTRGVPDPHYSRECDRNVLFYFCGVCLEIIWNHCRIGGRDDETLKGTHR
jgi:hypothetical protein